MKSSQGISIGAANDKLPLLLTSFATNIHAVSLYACHLGLCVQASFFQSEILTYNANNATEHPAVVHVFTPKSINPIEPFHSHVLVHLKGHENTHGTKAIVYGGKDFPASLSLSVEQDENELNSKSFQVVTTSNDPPTGNQVNLQTERIFVTVIPGNIASFVVTAK